MATLSNRIMNLLAGVQQKVENVIPGTRVESFLKETGSRLRGEPSPPPRYPQQVTLPQPTLMQRFAATPAGQFISYPTTTPIGKTTIQQFAQKYPDLPRTIAQEFEKTAQQAPVVSRIPGVQTAARATGNVMELLARGVGEMGTGAYRTAKGVVGGRPLQTLAGLGETLYGGSKIAVAGTPLFNILSLIASSPFKVGKGDYLRRPAAGFIEGIGLTPGLAENVPVQNTLGLNIPGIGKVEIDPLRTAGSMVGFTQNPVNKKLFQMTEKLIPAGNLWMGSYQALTQKGATAALANAIKWLGITGGRGVVEDILIDMKDMPDNVSLDEKVKFMINSGITGAVTEIGGRSIFDALGAAVSPAVRKAAKEQLAAIYDVVKNNLDEFKKPVTVGVDAGGKPVTRPAWAVVAQNALQDETGGIRLGEEAGKAGRYRRPGLQQALPNMKENIIMQIERNYPDVRSLIEKVDIQKAKTVAEAIEKIEKALPQDIRNKPAVQQALDAWKGQFEQIVEGKTPIMRLTEYAKKFTTQKEFLDDIVMKEGGVMDKTGVVKRGGYRDLADFYQKVTGVKAKGITVPPSVPPAGAPPKTANQKVIEALEEAKSLRGQQERLYKQARAEKLTRMMGVRAKTSGEAGFKAELAALGGELPKVEYEPLLGKAQLTQADIDSLMEQVKMSTRLTEWEKIPARKGLAKLFAKEGGTVPTKGELSLLNRVFGEDFTQAVLEKRSLGDKAWDLFLQGVNLPRTLMTSYDLSGALRQGLLLMTHPKRFFSNFKDMFKYFANEDAWKASQQEIFNRPTYRLMEENGVAIMNLGSSIGPKEEAFMSNLGEKIPVIGGGVRASNRAYVGFLNKLRADIFDDFVKTGEELGIDDPKYLKSAATYVNTASGRGSLGRFERSSLELSTAFFSPRLMASRFALIDPAFYTGLHPEVRKQAVKDMLKLIAGGISFLTLAKLAGDAFDWPVEVGTDFRSADAGKLKIGNTRIDIWGGYQQPVRLLSQLITGQIVSSTTGTVMEIEGGGFLTRLDVLGRFFEYKTSPITSLAVDLLRGETAIGEPLTLSNIVGRRFIPMFVQDMYDAIKEHGVAGSLIAPLAMFGVGVQTYGASLPTELNEVTKGMSKEDINALKEARVEKLQSKEFIDKISKKLLKEVMEAKTNEEALTILNNYSNANILTPEIMEEVMNLAEESRLSVGEKKLKNQDIETRARIIYGTLKGMPEEKRSAYLQDMFNKNILTDNVMTRMNELIQEEQVEQQSQGGSVLFPIP